MAPDELYLVGGGPERSLLMVKVTDPGLGRYFPFLAHTLKVVGGKGPSIQAHKSPTGSGHAQTSLPPAQCVYSVFNSLTPLPPPPPPLWPDPPGGLRGVRV